MPFDHNKPVDGSCSDLYDALVAAVDRGEYESFEQAADDLCLFIERANLSSQARDWLEGRMAGKVPGRQPHG